MALVAIDVKRTSQSQFASICQSVMQYRLFVGVVYIVAARQLNDGISILRCRSMLLSKCVAVWNATSRVLQQMCNILSLLAVAWLWLTGSICRCRIAIKFPSK